MKNNFSELWNHEKLNISRTIYFEKNFPHRFEGIIFTDKLEGFFFSKIYFFKDLELFSRLQNHSFGPHFFSQKDNLIFFLSVIIYFRRNIKKKL